MDSVLSPDPRRRFLALATGTVGGVGLAATTIMFVESMQPSERAPAAARSKLTWPASGCHISPAR